VLWSPGIQLLVTHRAQIRGGPVVLTFYVNKYIDHHVHEYAFSLIYMNMITQVQIAPESGGATEEYLMTISSQNT